MLISLLIVLGVGFGLALLVWKVCSAPRMTQHFSRSFRAQKDAEVQEDPRSGRRLGIKCCTALDPARDVEPDAQRLAEGMLVQPPQSTADRDRVTEELLIELQRR